MWTRNLWPIVCLLLSLAAGCSDAGSTEEDTEGDPSGSGDGDSDGDADGDTDADSDLDTEEPTLTDGCGKTDFPEDGAKTIDVDGTTREYIVTLPESYDPTHPYKLIFAWHGLTGTMDQIASRFWGYYGLQSLSNDTAIFVAGQGLPSEEGGTDYGWPNTDGRDIAFTRQTLAWLEANYCIDAQRIFSVGMSYGGMMSNTVGCEMGDVVRAIAPIAGAGPNAFLGAPECTGRVAAWIAHGTSDETVDITMGEASRDHWLEAASCDMTSQPVDPSPCVAYDGCDAGYPVIWCAFDGGHEVPSFAADAIWPFFDQF